MPWDSAVLPKLRRSQLVWLAKAYAVKIDPDATKDRILPILIAAEQQGVFRGRIADQYAFARASLTPDDPPLGHWTGPQSIDDAAPAKHSVNPVEQKARAAQVRGISGFHFLQQECKGRGINCAGRNSEWMRDAIRSHDEAKNNVVDEGVPSQEPDMA